MQLNNLLARYLTIYPRELQDSGVSTTKVDPALPNSENSIYSTSTTIPQFLTTTAINTLPIISSDISLSSNSLESYSLNTEITDSQATPVESPSLYDAILTTSSTPDDNQITVIFTQTSNPSINLVIPTITTNTLPTYNIINPHHSYNNQSFTNSSINSSSFLNYRNSSSSHSSISLYSSIYTSSQPIINSTSSINYPSTLTSGLLNPSHLLLPPTQLIVSTSSTKSSSSSHKSFPTSSLSTKTVTEYLENLTYTQIYVITAPETTITTGLLATTSFYVHDLSSTYLLSPPAITTDSAVLKGLTGYHSIFDSHHGLSKGSIAGIAVGSIIGFLILLTAFYFILKWSNNRKWKDNKNGGIFGHDNEMNDYNPFKVNDLDNEEEDDEGEESDNSRDIRTPRNAPISKFSNNNLPPIPNRANKPNLTITTPNMTTELLNSTPEPLEEEEEEEDSDDGIDMSLFDMKSTLNEINASTEKNQHLMPPVPPSRKSKSSNRIDKMNYQVEVSTPSPKLPIDRTMGVLYESPNEHCIWDEFDGAKDSGLMVKNDIYENESSSGSPLVENFPSLKLDSGYISKKGDYKTQLNNSNNYDDFIIKGGIINRTRVGSGSSATRYEYLKERLNSTPTKTNFDFNDFDLLTNEQVVEDKNTNKKIPPPVPAPRKQFDF